MGLEGIENILKQGEENKEALGGEAINEYAAQVKEAGGKDKLEPLQVRRSHLRSA